MDRTHYDRSYDRNYKTYHDQYAREEQYDNEGKGRFVHHHGGDTSYHTKGNQAIKAGKGFHGVIKKETHFIIGESGAERVNITPIKKLNHHKKPSNSMKQVLGFDPMEVLDW